MTGLQTQHLTLGYHGPEPVITGLDLTIPTGQITSIIGANGSGKSTLLRGLARLLTPQQGTIRLDGRSIHDYATKAMARQIGLLPQDPTVPQGLTVEDLVARGRYPHQSLLRQWSAADEEAVEVALTATATRQLRERPVEELSGGQRQRVWIALALAQDTPILLLDEPTTFLDLAHQHEILQLLTTLNRRDGKTIVLVLHDLNQAARYSHHLIALRDGQLIARGAPEKVITEAIVAETYGVTSVIITDPGSGTPHCLPGAPIPTDPPTPS